MLLVNISKKLSEAFPKRPEVSGFRVELVGMCGCRAATASAGYFAKKEKTPSQKGIAKTTEKR